MLGHISIHPFTIYPYPRTNIKEILIVLIAEILESSSSKISPTNCKRTKEIDKSLGYQKQRIIDAVLINIKQLILSV